MLIPVKLALAFKSTIGTALLAYSAIALTNGKNASGLDDPTLATNPGGVADWSSSVPFIDLMKQSRPFQAGGDTPRDWHYLKDNGFLDEEGWPARIPPGTHSVGTTWDWEQFTGTYLWNKPFTLRWEGVGTVSLWGAVKDVVTRPNEISFRLASTPGAFGLSITSMSSPPENPKNFTLIRDDHRELFEGGERINPDYLKFNEDMRLLRFMDWMQTNWSRQAHWSDRPMLSDVTYANINDEGNSVPLELIVEYCNKVMADCWVNFPHMATDDYIRSMVTYVRDNLDPGLTAYFELSNEVWNSTFPHHSYFTAQARIEWPDAANGVNDFALGLNYYGKRAADVFLVVNALYRGVEHRRVNVLGAINDDTSWVAEQVMAAPAWRKYGRNYVKPASVAQALAIAPYYGLLMAAVRVPQ